jgi:CubicO group peptidase (beta-lactamase class C family)
MGQSPAPQPLLAEHLKLSLVREPGSRESYSNTGYVALTVIIEEKSGKPYETYCRESVLDKLGIDARLHPDWATYSGSGAWYISGADYLKFLEIFDTENPFLGDQVKAWIDQGQTRSDTSNRNNWYSLGVATNVRNGRRAVSHVGLLNSRGKDPHGRPIAAIISSAGTRNFDGVGTFVAMTPTWRANRAIRELRTQLGRAHQAVKVWP